MNTTQTRYAAPQMRASDADRDAALAELSKHFQAGRLTSDELDERTGRALQARTMGELQVLMSDLPTAPVPATPSGPVPATSLRPQLPLFLIAAVVVAVVVSVGLGFAHGPENFGWVLPVLIIARLAFRRGSRRMSR
jgi:Domain of unknown function (DUF1707)